MKQEGQHQSAGERAQQLHVQRQRHLGGGHGGGDEEEVELVQHPREAGDNLEQEDTGDYNNLKMGYIIIIRKNDAQITDDPESTWGPIIYNCRNNKRNNGVQI